MENKTIKMQRTSILLKSIMGLVVFLLTLQIYQTNTIDFNKVAATTAILALLRGLLLSPSLLTTPIKFKLSKKSYPYLILTIVLFIVSAGL